jgi:hypothetical protein
MIQRAIVFIAVAFSVNAASAAEWPTPETYLAPSCEAAASPKMCELGQREWVDDYKLAIAGDYQGQRNVAFCLRDGCDDAVLPNLVLSCAWRLAILKAGHLELESTDFSNVKLLCTPQKMGADEFSAAESQARQILKMIASRARIAPSH